MKRFASLCTQNKIRYRRAQIFTILLIYAVSKQHYNTGPHLFNFRRQEETWHPEPKAKNEAGFYTVKAAVELVFQRLGIDDYRTSEAPAGEFSYGLQYHKGPMVLENFGAVLPLHLRARQIKADVFYADINWDNVLKVLPKKLVQVKTPSRFPSLRRDLALILDKKITFAEVERLARKAEKNSSPKSTSSTFTRTKTSSVPAKSPTPSASNSNPTSRP